MQEKIIIEDTEFFAENLSDIYEVIETPEGRQAFIIQCQEGAISPEIARGVLVYLQICQEEPTDLVIALHQVINNAVASAN